MLQRDPRRRPPISEVARRFEQLAREYHPPMHDPPLDLAGLLAAVELNGGFVGPWMAEPVVECGVARGGGLVVAGTSAAPAES